MLYLLMGKNAGIRYIYHDQGKAGNGAVTLIKKFSRKVEAYTEEEALVIDIKLKLKASVTEYMGVKQLDKEVNLVKLEKEVAESIKKDYEKLIKYLQQINSDPPGFGEMIREKHNEYWKSVKCKEIYKDVIFSVDVNVEFEFYGAVN